MIHQLSFVKMGILLLASSLFLFACKTTEKTSNNKSDAFSEEYYQNMANNLERLQMLQAGLFVQYTEKENGSLAVWALNDSEDSMILYVTPVGNPHKDGYWLYGHQFISNLPNAPVVTTFIKIENLNRDTFIASYYLSPTTYSWEKVKKNEMNNIVFDSLKASGEQIYFTKVNNSHFEGQSGLYKNPVAGQDNYRQDIYVVKPDRITFHPTWYDINDKKKLIHSGSREHLLRLKKSSSSLMK